MATSPFVIIPSLTAIAVAYKQANLIADEILPRVPVATEVFRYLKYNQADAFQAPDTSVSRKGAPNQLDFGSSEATGAVTDQALDVAIPNHDQIAWEQAHAAGPGYVSAADPQSRATRLVTQAVQNRREYRASNLVFNAANYGTNNKVTLSGTSQWSDYTNSDPLIAILGYLDSMIMRPNITVMGRAVATKLRSHPKICKAIFGMQTDAGIVPLEALASLLEMDKIYVGDGWVNTAAPGQPAVLTRCWGKHCSFLVRNQEADTQGGVTFGFTAQWGDKVAGTILDPDVGMRGGVRVRSGESVVELVTANDLGYFMQNAVA
jgi:hypothetical protein